MNKVFLLLYIFIGLVPIFEAADKSSTQLLYLQIVNLGFIVYFLFFVKKEKKIAFVANLKSSLFILFLMFFCWSLLSIIVSINKVESLKTLTLIVTYLTTFSVLYYLINEIKGIKVFFINVMLTLLSIEIFTVISPFVYDIIEFANYAYRSQTYSGLTGNINIAAFSILMKLPFAFYRAINSKKIKSLVFNIFLIISGIFSIFSVSQTRGAILGVIFISFLLLVYMFILFFKKRLTSIEFIKRISIIVLPLLLNILLNNYQSQFSSAKQSDLAGRLETVTNLEDTSNNSRLRYWKQSIITGISNPIFGIGIGNWKLKGIETDNANLNNYIVPYHSHNDFLEFFAETGVIGFLFYSGFLFFTLIVLIYFFVKKNKTPSIIFYLILAIIVYLLDSSLNFPFARPIQQMSFFSIIIYSILILKNQFGFDDSFNYLNKPFLLKVVGGVLIFISPFSLYSSARLFTSSTQQFILLGQFNLNIFNTPLSEVEAYESDYPNISETTIPLATFKGLYNLKSGNIERAIDLFHKARKANPYLMINETYLGYSYYKLNKKDSSLYYSKKAFKKQPNNSSHFAHYLISLAINNDSLEIKNAYNEIKKFRKNDPDIDKIYYLSLSNLLDKDDNRKFLDDSSKNLLQSYETDDLTRVNLYILEYGENKVKEADALYELGEKLFKEKKYLESAQSFEAAGKINPLELPYFENAANAYMQISKLEEALENINYVINNSKTPNGKALYIKALIYLEKGDKIPACKLLSQSAQNGFTGANNLAKAYCK